MSQLQFHRCLICGAIFYCGKKDRYCSRCIPKYCSARDEFKMINDWSAIEDRRAKERARWHKRMSSPAFREKERIRSLVRARVEKKYAVENSQ